jgi:hypothetical protein
MQLAQAALQALQTVGQKHPAIEASEARKELEAPPAAYRREPPAN